jgi:Protein of unknown function (DUF1552)
VKYRNVLNRRTFLRGAGTIAIGLPALDAMRSTSVYAAAPEPPMRAFNLFHGLGVPTPLQAEGYDGPLEPLGELSGKMALLRGVDHVRCDEAGINAHFDGAAGAFTATPPNGEALAGGPSIDQLVRQHFYPDGLPTGTLSTVLMGTYFRRSRPARFIHCWNPDGSPASLPKEDPIALFELIFGTDPSMNSGEETPEEARKRRYHQSVLDSVVEQYKHWTSEASGLGATSRARIADHLEKVREYEQRVFGELPEGCVVPTKPVDSNLPHGGSADPDGQGIDITVDALVSEWRLMADLYALAIQCDVVRFGGLTFQAAGERIRLTGNYSYNGQTVYDFDDQGERGTGGAEGCSHEWWHEFNVNNSNTQLRAHIHLMQRELAYFLKLLDDPEHADDNGLTILENSLVVVSTESGDGRHNDVQRELSGIYHAISGCNERFKVGTILDVDSEGIDVYNTMLQALGVPTKLGPTSRPVSEVAGILA